jgi:hypothetical protein
VGASTSHNSMDLHGLLQGYLYFSYLVNNERERMHKEIVVTPQFKLASRYFHKSTQECHENLTRCPGQDSSCASTTCVAEDLPLQPVNSSTLVHSHMATLPFSNRYILPSTLTFLVGDKKQQFTSIQISGKIIVLYIPIFIMTSSPLCGM